MIDVLVSTAAFTLVVAVLTAGLVLVTVAPLYLALQLADNRGFSTTRWTLITSSGVVAGLGAAYVLHGRDGTPSYAMVVALVLTYLGPLALLVLGPGQHGLGGRAGDHE